MRPLGRTPKRFPSKVDCHPGKGYINWWEEENDDGNKAKERERVRKEINRDYLMESINNVFDFSQIMSYINEGNCIVYAEVDYDRDCDCLIFKTNDDVFNLPRVKRS